MSTSTSETAITSEIQVVLNRYEIAVRESDVKIRHPNLGVTTIRPSVYAVYLAAIKANYTLVFLMEIDRNPSEAIAAYGYLSSMIDDRDDLPWFSDADVANGSQLLEQANADLAKCISYLAEVGAYDLLD